VSECGWLSKHNLSVAIQGISKVLKLTSRFKERQTDRQRQRDREEKRKKVGKRKMEKFHTSICPDISGFPRLI
jgi:hypothetical protein